MKNTAVALVLLSVAAGASAQEIDEAIISPRFEYPPELVLEGAFVAYASGAVEGGYYYMLPTNNYLSTLPAGAVPKGECRYFDTVAGIERRISEQVIGYRGDNTFDFFQSTNPAFTRFRTVSPCFDGRFGEETEQQHRTAAYGAGSTVVSAVKGKAYLTVNRTRFRTRPDSTSPYELASNGAEWQAGDFDQIFIGAKETLSAAMNTPTSTSMICRGQLNPPPSENCTPAFVWKFNPLVRITDGLVDPVDGQVKTFTALPPHLAEVNAATGSLPIFSGISSLGALLFGFMEFGHICVAWDTTQSKPLCTQPGLPSRIAAVFLTDTSTGVRPFSARLHFKKGSSWIPMNDNGTFPAVPDDFGSTLGIYSLNDVKFNPIHSTWNAWTEEIINTDASTPGCEDPFSDGWGTRLVFVNLATYAKTAFWPSRNGSGRITPVAHYVFSPSCNCLRQFIFYTTTDYPCYNLPKWQKAFGPLGSEVVVRRYLDGAPNQ